MEAQLSAVLQANSSSPFIIHAFSDLDESEKINLSKLTKLCQVRLKKAIFYNVKFLQYLSIFFLEQTHFSCGYSKP
jgi:hypothetical protein